MSVQKDLLPTYSKKLIGGLKAEREVKRVNLNVREAGPGDILEVNVPKLSKNKVIVPGSLALIFDIDLKGGEANNFVVQNVSRALVSKMVMRYEGTVLEELDNYDIYKIYEDLFLSQEKRETMVFDGIQSEDLCKIRSGSGDKKTSGVAAEQKLNGIYGSLYRIKLDHQILTDNGAFYHHALYNQLKFDLTLASAAQVVRGSDATKLTYQLKNIQLEYEIMTSPRLADEAERAYEDGKEFLYDHVQFQKIVAIDRGTQTLVNITVTPQRRSLKAILLLFLEKYDGGARDSEKYVFPDLKKVKVAVKGIPNMIYSEGIESRNMWEEASRYFVQEKNKTGHMTMKKFYTEDKFGLIIDLRSMASHKNHGSGTRLVNSNEGVQLDIEREASGSKKIYCYVYTISDAQFNVMGRQLQSVQY